MSGNVRPQLGEGPLWSERENAPPRAHERVFEAIRVQDPAEARQAMMELVQMALDDTKMIVPTGKTSDDPVESKKAGRTLKAERSAWPLATLPRAAPRAPCGVFFVPQSSRS